MPASPSAPAAGVGAAWMGNPHAGLLRRAYRPLDARMAGTVHEWALGRVLRITWHPYTKNELPSYSFGVHGQERRDGSPLHLGGVTAVAGVPSVRMAFPELRQQPPFREPDGVDELVRRLRGLELGPFAQKHLIERAVDWPKIPLAGLRLTNGLAPLLAVFEWAAAEVEAAS